MTVWQVRGKLHEGNPLVTTKVSPDGDKAATAVYKVMPLRKGHCSPHRSVALHLGVQSQTFDWLVLASLENPQANT
jgi:hypothetical protein